MKLFLWIQLIASAILLISRMFNISWGSYPRVQTYSRAQDTFGMVIGIAFGLWEAWLLFVVLQ